MFCRRGIRVFNIILCATVTCPWRADFVNRVSIIFPPGCAPCKTGACCWVPKGWLQPGSQVSLSSLSLLCLHFSLFSHPLWPSIIFHNSRGPHSHCILWEYHLLEHSNDTDCLSQLRPVIIAGFGCSPFIFAAAATESASCPPPRDIPPFPPCEFLWCQFLFLSVWLQVSGSYPSGSEMWQFFTLS